jgi:hypothetical protein
LNCGIQKYIATWENFLRHGISACDVGDLFAAWNLSLQQGILLCGVEDEDAAFLEHFAAYDSFLRRAKQLRGMQFCFAA